MATYVLMTKLPPGQIQDAEGRRTTGRDWLNKVKSACPEVKWQAHYALLGPYDFMDIYEAPDGDTALRVALISRTEGAVTAESWRATPYDRFLKVLEEIGD